MAQIIVVPLDGSRYAEQALPLAVELAKRQHAELDLVHVFEALPPYLVQGAPPIDPALDMELRRERQQYLEGLADRLRSGAPVNVRCRTLISTDVANTLAEYLAERCADLTILTTRGRGGFNGIWVGSVPTRLVRHSQVPVLLVRAREGGVPDAGARIPQKILVPLDLTPVDEEALDGLAAIATPGETELFLLNVREPAPLSDLDAPTVAPYSASELESGADDYLERLARRIRSRGFVVTPQVVVDESPANAILQFADAWKMDLIVLELEPHAQTRGAWRHLPGRVTEKVMRDAHVPVLIYRRPIEVRAVT